MISGHAGGYFFLVFIPKGNLDCLGNSPNSFICLEGHLINSYVLNKVESTDLKKLKH